MIYISIDDFYEKVGKCERLSRAEEIECAKLMKSGDVQARERLIQSYLPMVAAHIKHTYARQKGLGLVLYCVNALEKAVDSFNFLQDSETFSHRMSWLLRQAVASYEVRGTINR